MQYILTQEEFDEFVSLRRKAKEMPDKDSLMELCRLAAEYIPVERNWSSDKSAQPWGCIYKKDGSRVEYHHCDNCPSQNVCPAKNKSWSK